MINNIVLIKKRWFLYIKLNGDRYMMKRKNMGKFEEHKKLRHIA